MIPIATTTITIRRPAAAVDDIQDPFGEGYDTPSDIPNQWSTIATGVRAVINTTDQGAASGRPGDTEEIQYRVVCDPTDMTYKDVVIDEPTGVLYSVISVIQTPAVHGLGNTRASLQTLRGITTTSEYEEK